MERVVIRTQLVQCISSKVIEQAVNDETLYELDLKYGRDYILRNIFDEEGLCYQGLSEEYEQFIQGGKSTLFSWMYIIKKDFGIVIDEHIYLYHYNFEISEQTDLLFSWKYMESEKYLGDSWWFKDEEILEDIAKLPVLDFLEKYRGY